MSTILRKRKRRAPPESNISNSPSASEDDADVVKALFQRHFEARFKPLPTTITKQQEPEMNSEDEDESAESDWSGVSSEAEQTVTIISSDTTTPQTDTLLSDKSELKAYLSSKPPSSTPKSLPEKAKATPKAADDEDSTENIKNDLALQRLLTESHLLRKDPTNSTNHISETINPSGKNRHKALDLRLQNLGSKASVFKQAKMPMAHRKGIVQKAQDREGKRRREAKESGIVLEKEKRKFRVQEKRERGVGGPGVGKFKGGMLTLSRRDIDSIQGPPVRKKGRR
ncbi:hypothetical protein EJ08DRAFT_633894 [Tothia fuscella]|uniref:Protein FAF1 n=1 Tax=Tothia fuscella TaxID=1048955 RepID=A0A9P4NS57_9PEZI|nr:hypothetical protein EJ08DRAFT_633894 [Tothia fuscella]